MVKDEADIIGRSIDNLFAQGVDLVVVADNGSLDGTRKVLLERDPEKVILIDDDEVGYYQSQKMTRLAHIAREKLDADWVIPFDADEFWLAARSGYTVRDAIEFSGREFGVLAAEVYDHVA